MRDPAPAHISNVKQSVHSIEVDESSKISDVLNDTLNYVARVDLIEKFAALGRSLLFN